MSITITGKTGNSVDSEKVVLHFDQNQPHYPG